MENQKKDRRFIGGVWKRKGQNGDFLQIAIDSPTPTKLDKNTGEEVEDKYHKGLLLWRDNATNEMFIVKQINVHKPGPKAAERGCTNSLSIDLDNEYSVIKLERE